MPIVEICDAADNTIMFMEADDATIALNVPAGGYTELATPEDMWPPPITLPPAQLHAPVEGSKP